MKSDNRKKEDVDSKFNRDDLLTRDSSSSGRQFNEWTTSKDRDETDGHRRTAETPVIVNTKDEVISTTDRKLSASTATEKTVSFSRMFSMLMSTEARQALYETWNRCLFQSNTRTPECCLVLIMTTLLSPLVIAAWSTSTATRTKQDPTIRGRKHDLISLSAVSSSGRRRRLHETTISEGHVTTVPLGRPQRSVVNNPSSRLVEVNSVTASANYFRSKIFIGYSCRKETMQPHATRITGPRRSR